MPIDFSDLGAKPAQAIDFSDLGAKPAAVQTETNKTAPAPGFFKRLGQSLGIPTSMDEVNAFDSHMRSPAGLLEFAMPGAAVGKAVYDYGKNVVGNVEDAVQEGKEAGENIASGQPVLPNALKTVYGGLRAGIRSIPLVGPSIQTAGEDVADKNYSGAAGGLTGVIGQIAAMQPEVSEGTAAMAKRAVNVPADATRSALDATHMPDALTADRLVPQVRVPGLGANLGL